MKQINKQIFRQIDDYLNYLMVFRGVAETTLRQKRTILLYFARATGLSGIEKLTNEVFSEWVEFLNRQGISASSINVYNSIVVTMVRYFTEIGVKVPLNLTLLQKFKACGAHRKFFLSAEIRQVVGLADFETGLMIKIMFETGMRIAELVRLRVRDFDGRRISFIGKGSKPREVYITGETLRLVRRYIARYGVRGYLWCVNDGVMSCNGEPPTVNTVRKRLREAFMAAGFDDFYPHALRHSFATDLQLRGASVAEIKEMMGHENIATTERYLHGFDGKLMELFDKYR